LAEAQGTSFREAQTRMETLDDSWYIEHYLKVIKRSEVRLQERLVQWEEAGWEPGEAFIRCGRDAIRTNDIIICDRAGQRRRHLFNQNLSSMNAGSLERIAKAVSGILRVVEEANASDEVIVKRNGRRQIWNYFDRWTHSEWETCPDM
jgi:hypothetical protein